MRITNLMGLTKAMKNRVPMAPKVLHIVYGKIICFVKFTHICFVNHVKDMYQFSLRKRT